MIEINGDKEDLKEALESFAYKLLQYKHPDWYEIPVEEIASLINEEPGCHAEVI